MSSISSSSLTNYTDGETVTASMLNQDNNVIKTAVNDNDSRITTLEGASQGQLSKIPSGTAWPSSPTEGYIFERTDLGLIGYYHNSAWIELVPMSGGTLTGTLKINADNTAIGTDSTNIRLAMVKKSGQNPVIGVASGAHFTVQKSDQTDLASNISGATMTNIFDVDPSGNITYQGYTIAPNEMVSVAVGVSSQSITSTTSDVQMTLQSQGNGYPGDSGWTTSNWTCPVAGLYEINTNIMVNAPTSSVTSAKLYLNGSVDQYLWSLTNYSGSMQMIGSGSSTIRKLAANDVLKFYVNCNASGGNIAGNYSRINIKKIG